MRITVTLMATALLTISSCKKNENNELPVNQLPVTEAPVSDLPATIEKQCYLKVIQKDSIILEFEKIGDSIAGIFHWKPYEKDKKLSTFRGTMDGSTANTVGMYNGEGVDYTEELIFTIENDSAFVKFGEMVQGTNGIWTYKDAEAAHAQALPKVDCR